MRQLLRLSGIALLFVGLCTLPAYAGWEGCGDNGGWFGPGCEPEDYCWGQLHTRDGCSVSCYTTLDDDGEIAESGRADCTMVELT